MHIQTSRDIGRVWVVAGIIFAASVGMVRFLGRNTDTKIEALWIGYVGLAALGVALLLSARWVSQRGPSSRVTRAVLQALIAMAFVAWLLALVFPFL